MASRYTYILIKKINKICATFSKVRLNYGLTHSFPFINYNNNNSKEEIIAKYDKYLRELYIEPHYILICDGIFPKLRIPKGLIEIIYEYEYGERAYRVFKHYLVHKLKSQHDSTIFIIPFVLGYIELICFILLSIEIFLNFYTKQSKMFAIFNSIPFKIYILCNLCHVIGICLSHVSGFFLSKKLKIMNAELLRYIYGTKKADEEDEESDVIFNFKRNYSNHSNCSNASNESTQSTQSTFSALHGAFGTENYNEFGHYTSLFIEDYMGRMIQRLAHIYDIAAFDGFQRWCNVYEIEIINDKFINHASILCVLLSKYVIPLIFSILLHLRAVSIIASDEILYLLLIFASCCMICVITYCCGILLFDLTVYDSLKKSISLAALSFIVHLFIFLHFSVKYSYSKQFTDYIGPAALSLMSVVLIYKFIYFPVVNHVILSSKCKTLAQSLRIYKIWSYLICVLCGITVLFILPTSLRKCKECTITSLLLSWILCIIIYVWIQLTCHQALTTMTPSMYLFNYVQYSRKWICEPILFLFVGQFVHLFPIFPLNY